MILKIFSNVLHILLFDFPSLDWWPLDDCIACLIRSDGSATAIRNQQRPLQEDVKREMRTTLTSTFIITITITTIIIITFIITIISGTQKLRMRTRLRAVESDMTSSNSQRTHVVESYKDIVHWENIVVKWVTHGGVELLKCCCIWFPSDSLDQSSEIEMNCAQHIMRKHHAHHATYKRSI